MQFKYSDYIEHTEDCPPNRYHPLETVVYRWVHEDINHPNNFLPTAIISPQLVNDSIDLKEKCKRYGLSFFNSLKNARERHQRVIAEHQKLVNRVGQHIAEGELSNKDGVGSKASRKGGHITFHEFVGVNLKLKFQVVGKADENE